MKKFLSTGLILSQVFSSSCILAADPVSNMKSTQQAPRDIVIVRPKETQKRNSSISGWVFKLIGLGFKADVILQLLCAKCPSIAVGLSKYADDNGEGGFKFSEYLRPNASLSKFEDFLDMDIAHGESYNISYNYFDKTLICKKITGGLQQAAKIAALGFAKDIYVKRNMENGEFEFYYMPGNYGLTSMDAYNYLKYLIEKVDHGHNLYEKLQERQRFFIDCFGYAAWTKATEAATEIKEKLSSKSNVKRINTVKSELPSKAYSNVGYGSVDESYVPTFYFCPLSVPNMTPLVFNSKANFQIPYLTN